MPIVSFLITILLYLATNIIKQRKEGHDMNNTKNKILNIIIAILETLTAISASVTATVGLHTQYYNRRRNLNLRRFLFL